MGVFFLVIGAIAFVSAVAFIIAIYRISHDICGDIHACAACDGAAPPDLVE